ncbi:flagellin N-terminal helical domain-containing protein [Propionispira raffinosivorans]|uniref:flagellin N-terminal helical domain-containing protein n=1 Tax=Propionispira raffinosivorans TaxID=86959 RepID=UPI0003688474|nr:flagellin [Propionispira raffinosivorans]
MSLVVKNNLSALNTLNIMNTNSTALNKSLKKVSSGMKINSAADDASGYQISERMRVQIKSLDQANQNAQNGSSLLKTAEGAVSSTVEIIKTLKQKVLNAANGTNTDSDLAAIQSEMNQSIDQINDNANVTFNGKYLVDGSASSATSATKSAFTNQSLGTATTGSSTLASLTNRDGKSLGIVSGDKISISYVVNGKTVTTSIRITDGASGTKISDIIGQATGLSVNTTATSVVGTGATPATNNKDGQGYTVHSTDGKNVLTIATTTAGVSNALAGFTINVTDKDGNAKKDVNKVLDNFTEAITAHDLSKDHSIQLQVGTKANQTISVGLSDMGAKALGLQGQSSTTTFNLDVTTQERATAAIDVLDKALQKALTQQTKIGSAESRLDYTSQNLTTSSENVTNAESTIRDADMAKEMTEYTKNNVLKQASQAMLAQANQSGSGVLSLLQ